MKLRTNTETGESALKVPSQEVKLTDIPYQKFKAAEQQWRLVDHYCNPGPVQFYDLGHDSIADSIEAHYMAQNKLVDIIKSLCNTIYKSTMFTDHKHLLVAAISSLKATQSVLDSNNDQVIQGHEQVNKMLWLFKILNYYKKPK